MRRTFLRGLLVAVQAAMLAWQPQLVHAGCTADVDDDGYASPAMSGGADCRADGCVCPTEDPYEKNPNCGAPDMDCDGEGDANCGKDRCAPSPNNCDPGRPVSAATGTAYLNARDFTLRWPEFSFALERTFVSNLPEAYVDHGNPGASPRESRQLGAGWLYTGGEQLLVETVQSVERCPGAPSMDPLDGQCTKRVRFRDAGGAVSWFTVNGTSRGPGNPLGETLTPPVGAEVVARLVAPDGTLVSPSAAEATQLHGERRIAVVRVADGRQWTFEREGATTHWRLLNIHDGAGSVEFQPRSASGTAQATLRAGSLVVGELCWDHGTTGLLRMVRWIPAGESCPVMPVDPAADAACVSPGAITNATGEVLTTYCYETPADSCASPAGAPPTLTLVRQGGAQGVSLRYEYAQACENTTGAARTRYNLVAAWEGEASASQRPTAGGAQVPAAVLLEENHFDGDGRVTVHHSARDRFVLSYGANLSHAQEVAGGNGVFGAPSGSTVLTRGTTPVDLKWNSLGQYIGSNSSVGRCAPRQVISLGCGGQDYCPVGECSTSTLTPFSGRHMPRAPAAAPGGNPELMDYDGRPRFLPLWRQDHRGLASGAYLLGIPRPIGGCATVPDGTFDRHGRALVHTALDQNAAEDVLPGAGTAGLSFYAERRSYLMSENPRAEPEGFVATRTMVSALESIRNAAGPFGVNEIYEDRTAHLRFGLSRKREQSGLGCSATGGATCVPTRQSRVTNWTRDEGPLQTLAVLRREGPGAGQQSRYCYHGLVTAECAAGSSAAADVGRLQREEIITGGPVPLTTQYLNYNVFGQAQVVVDANGQRQLLAYDSAGRMVGRMDVQGGITATCYLTGTNAVEHVRHPQGNYTTYRRDVFGRVTEVLQQSGSNGPARPPACGSLGDVTSVVPEACLAQLQSWGGCGTGVNSNTVESTRLTLNDEGQVLTREDHNARGEAVLRETRAYDHRPDQATAVSEADGRREYAYSAGGDVTRVKTFIDLDSTRETQYRRDGWGRVLDERTYNSAGLVLSRSRYGYDHRGNMRVVQACLSPGCLSNMPDEIIPDCASSYEDAVDDCSIDVAGAVVTWYRYNDFGELVEVDSPDSGITRYAHDTAGNVVWRGQYAQRADTQAVSEVVYAYDLANRLVQAQSVDTTELYFWDAEVAGANRPNLVGRLARVDVTAPAFDRTLTKGLHYDVLGRLVREDQRLGDVTTALEYTFDANGNRTSLRYPSNNVIHEQRDAAQLRVTALLASAGSGPQVPLLDGVEYQPGGGVTFMRHGNQTTSRVERDARGLVTRMNTPWAGDNLALERDLSGNPLSALGQNTRPVPGTGGTLNLNHSRLYEYDGLERLTSHITLRAPSLQDDFTYDAAGNRTRRTRQFDGEQKFWDYEYAQTPRPSNRISYVNDPATGEAACNGATGPGQSPCFPGQATRTLVDTHAKASNFDVPAATQACVDVTARCGTRVLVDGVEVMRLGEADCPSGRHSDASLQRQAHVPVAVDGGNHHVKLRRDHGNSGHNEDTDDGDHPGSDEGWGDVVVRVTVPTADCEPAGVDVRLLRKELKRLFRRIDVLLDILEETLPPEFLPPDAHQHRDDDGDDAQDPTELRGALNRVVEQVQVVARVARLDAQDVIRILDANPELRTQVEALLGARRLPSRREVRALKRTVRDLLLQAGNAVFPERTRRDPRFRYTYDGRGNVTSIQPVQVNEHGEEVGAGRGVCMRYDGKGRMTQLLVTRTFGTPSVPPPPLGEPDPLLQYLDCAGRNRPGDPPSTSELLAPELFTETLYDERNLRVVKRTFGIETRYVYDGAGQLLAEVNGATGLVAKEYVYLNGSPVVMRVHALGGIAAAVGCGNAGTGGWAAVLLLGLLWVARRRRGGRGQDGAAVVLVALLVVRCGPGGGGGGGGLDQSVIPPTDYWFHNDWVDTPQALTDGDGRIAWLGWYEAYGRVYRVEQNLGFSGPTVSNNMRFPGQYEDAETALGDLLVGTPFHYNWNRHYDPSAGRYLEADPLDVTGRIRHYGYANGAPTRAVDPTGLDTIGCTIPPRFRSLLMFIGAACKLKCCALHDECYYTWKCSSDSWGNYNPCNEKECQQCNDNAGNCFLECMLAPWKDPLGGDPKKSMYFCAATGQYLFGVQQDDLPRLEKQCECTHKCPAKPWPR